VDPHVISSNIPLATSSVYIKNAFLNDILDEEVYMEQPPGFIAQDECESLQVEITLRSEIVSESQIGCFALVIQELDRCHAEKDHYVFSRIQHGKRIMLVVYVDDIVIIRDGTKGIDSLKKYLQKHFQTEDLGSLNYFLGIEVVRSKKSIFYYRISM